MLKHKVLLVAAECIPHCSLFFMSEILLRCIFTSFFHFFSFFKHPFSPLSFHASQGMKAKWIGALSLSLKSCDQAVYAPHKQPPFYTWHCQFFRNKFNSEQGVHLWGCDIFHVIYSIVPSLLAVAAPSAPSPCHQLWQSQPLFMQWEAAFFQRDDLLCLHRRWHQGCDPARGLDSACRKLGTKYTSCHPNSAVHMLPQTRSPTSEWRFDGSCSLRLAGPSDIISTGIMEPPREDQILWGK